MALKTEGRIGASAYPEAVPVDVLAVGRSRRLAILASTALPPPRFRLRFSTEDNALESLFIAAADVILVLLDGHEADVFTRCRNLRTAADAAILAIGESSSLQERLSALRCVDDYITLPVAPAELAARVFAVLRRTGLGRDGGSPDYNDGNLHIDFRTRIVSLRGAPVNLTPTEYRLLTLLAANPGVVFTHDQILQRVWGSSFEGDSHLVRLQIANLRSKIDAPNAPSHILTQRGIGYAFRIHSDNHNNPTT